MRYSIILSCVCFFLNVNGENVASEKYTVFGYHEKIGIPLANDLRWSELMTRIVGGSASSNILKHPHQAGILTTLTTGASSVCGGSLIAKNRILTAAHCWWDGQSQATRFTVVLGSITIFTGGTRIITSDITVHPNWNVNDITNDIAIAKIQNVALSTNIQVIALPTAAEARLDFSGLTGTITGFGKTSDAQTSFPQTTALHETTVSIMTNQACQAGFDIKIHDSHLCTSGAGGRGTCDGDSGGPLTVVHNNVRKQIGIVSFGLADRCQSGNPSVYTRVTSFLTWINAQM